MSHEGYFAVAEGRIPGIYTNMKDCMDQVKGFSGAVFKRYDTRAEAQAFIDGNVTTYAQGARRPAYFAMYRGRHANGAWGDDGAFRYLPYKAIDLPPHQKVAGARKKAEDDTEDEDDDEYCEEEGEFGYYDSDYGYIFYDDDDRFPGPGYDIPYDEEDYYDEDEDDEICIEPLQGPTKVIYVDGACSSNGKGTAARAGYGIYYGESNPNNVSAPISLCTPNIPGLRHTNIVAELVAVVSAIWKALEAVGVTVSPADGGTVNVRKCHTLPPLLHIHTDSQFVVDGLSNHLKKWSQNGFITCSGAPVQNQQLWKVLSRLRDIYNGLYWKQVMGFERPFDPRSTDNEGQEAVWVRYIPAHAGILGNQRADKLARDGIGYDTNGNTKGSAPAKCWNSR